VTNITFGRPLDQASSAPAGKLRKKPENAETAPSTASYEKPEVL
jgi:hypothetical protein